MASGDAPQPAGVGEAPDFMIPSKSFTIQEIVGQYLGLLDVVDVIDVVDAVDVVDVLDYSNDVL